MNIVKTPIRAPEANAFAEPSALTGCSCSVAATWRSVVLPEPLGPRSAQRSPARIVHSIGPRMRVPERRTATPARRTMGVGEPGVISVGRGGVVGDTGFEPVTSRM